jgi:hypothetical protein
MGNLPKSYLGIENRNHREHISNTLHSIEHISPLCKHHSGQLGKVEMTARLSESYRLKHACIHALTTPPPEVQLGNITLEHMPC